MTVLKNLFSGTRALTFFILRRDRLRIPAWLLGVVGMTVACVPLVTEMFTQEDLAATAEMMQNPAMIAMVGPTYADEIGAIYAGMMLVFMALFAGAMNIFLITRHTRQDEEQGRLELVRSLPVGRLANLAAALLMALKVNVVMALLIGAGMAAFQVETIDLFGSLLFGFSMAAAGLVFAGVTAIFCQISSNNRTASGLALLFLVAMYMLRAVGDVGTEAFALMSPLGLISRTQVYVENVLWPVFVLFGVFAVLAVLALVLAKTRDLGQGLIAARPGTADGDIRSSLGLALRLTRTSFLVWAFVLALFGVAYGSVLNEIENFFAGSEMFQEAFAAGLLDGQSFTDQFVGLIMVIMSVVAAIPVVGFMLRLRGEEKNGYLEQLLSGSVCRYKLFGAYLGIALVAGVLFQVLAVLALWGAAAMVLYPTPEFLTYLQAALNYLPAIWVLLGMAAALVGYLPSKTGIAYGYLGVSFFLVYLGTLANLPEWVLHLSPFGHIPRLPLEEQNWIPLAILTAIAAVLIALGFVGYRKRDVKTN